MYFTVVAQVTPLCNRPSGIYIFSGFSEKKSLGWFIFHWVFHLSCVFHIKAGRGGRPYIFTGMKTLNTLYKRFTLFYARLTTCTLPILFLSMVIMFCIFASFKQIWTIKIHWSCKSHDRKWPGKQKISRVESNYSPGIREAKLSLGRLNLTTG